MEKMELFFFLLLLQLVKPVENWTISVDWKLFFDHATLTKE